MGAGSGCLGASVGAGVSADAGVSSAGDTASAAGCSAAAAGGFSAGEAGASFAGAMGSGEADSEPFGEESGLSVKVSAGAVIPNYVFCFLCLCLDVELSGDYLFCQRGCKPSFSCEAFDLCFF